MEEDVHHYTGEEIEVSYDVNRCIHVRECVHGLPDVFDPDRRPWIDPAEGTADEIARVVTACPTGALGFERTDGGPAEAVPDANEITVAPDGPLYVRGDVEIRGSDEDVVLRDTRVALCRCGLSTNKPLCDGTHADGAFEADGFVTPNESGETEPPSGPLEVVPTADGPLLLQGEFEIRSGGENGDRTEHGGGDDERETEPNDDYQENVAGSRSAGAGTFRDSRAALCRCGASADKPFCDGTHTEIGFEAE